MSITDFIHEASSKFYKFLWISIVMGIFFVVRLLTSLFVHINLQCWTGYYYMYFFILWTYTNFLNLIQFKLC
jgi:hypothetical protein